MGKASSFENQILLGDCLEWLGKIPEGSIDLIFADPPYGQQLAERTLQVLDKGNVIKKGGIFIVEHRSDEHLPQTLLRLNILSERSYGLTAVHFFQCVERKE